MKQHFPLFAANPDLIYFDNAATTQKPAVVIEALTKFYTEKNAPVHRSTYCLAEEATQLYEEARAAIASFIHASSASEIIFTKNCTESINTVAYGWARWYLKAGDEIVLTELEHHANILPWYEIARCTGAVIRWIPVLEDLSFATDTIETIINEKTKLLAMTLSSNVIGPVDEYALHCLVQRAQSVGAKILLDAAQVPAHARIDVQRLGCSFLAFSGHKMFGPYGIGVLYINRTEHDHMKPHHMGGGMVQSMTNESPSIWKEMPYRMEAGSPSVADAYALGFAAAYMQNMLSHHAISMRETSLTARLIDGLVSLKGVRILGNISLLKRKGHMVSFFSPRMHAHDLAAACAVRNICVRAGNHCCQPLHHRLGITASVRASFALYNTIEEVDALLEVVDQSLRMP